MARSANGTTLTPSMESHNAIQAFSTQTISPANVSTEALNPTIQHDCVVMKLNQTEFLPWDNPDNIISAEVENMLIQMKNYMLGILFLIGGPANLMNMAVFCRQGVKDRVTMCLFALALADELFLDASMFFNGEQLINQFTTGERFVPIRSFMTNNHLLVLLGFSFVSAVFSSIIAVERCYCVLYPLTYQTVMRSRTMAALIIIVYVVVLAFYFLAVGFRFRIGCMYNPLSGVITNALLPGYFYEAHKHFLHAVHSAIFGVGLPILTTVVVTVSTIITAVKLRQIVTWRAESTATISAKEVALTKMLVASSILFIICIVPTAVSRNVSLIFPGMNIGRRNHNVFLATVWISETFTFINSSLNIFLYYTMGSRYRKTFWIILGRKEKSEQKS